ncbi:MAG: TetR/AcrR family transcriptional regulator [Bacteroidetes bacterium]|nr:TetR/AcrR family transcriptional regulator [Bacteroidota bacterium]
MVKKKPIKKLADASTEERIKEAARKLFTQKGYEATRTREIAEEAGMNLALLNYYFRSKEKLFDIIMQENLQHFMKGVYIISHDETTTWQEKIEKLVAYYIDMLVVQPDIPLFVINEIRNNPEKFANMIHSKAHLMDSPFMKQLLAGIKKGEIIKVNPMHLMANIMGLTVFPFLSAPLLKLVGKMNQKQFTELMQERKKLVPIWLYKMMKAN